MKKLYLDRGDYKIVGLLDDNEKLKGFVITDRNMELLFNRMFKIASEAIMFAEANENKLIVS